MEKQTDTTQTKPQSRDYVNKTDKNKTVADADKAKKDTSGSCGC